jgi:hypothetical protein
VDGTEGRCEEIELFGHAWGNEFGSSEGGASTDSGFRSRIRKLPRRFLLLYCSILQTLNHFCITTIEFSPGNTQLTLYMIAHARFSLAFAVWSAVARRKIDG